MSTPGARLKAAWRRYDEKQLRDLMSPFAWEFIGAIALLAALHYAPVPTWVPVAWGVLSLSTLLAPLARVLYLRFRYGYIGQHGHYPPWK